MEDWEGCKQCGRKGTLMPDPLDCNVMVCKVCKSKFRAEWKREQGIAGVF